MRIFPFNPFAIPNEAVAPDLASQLPAPNQYQNEPVLPVPNDPQPSKISGSTTSKQQPPR